MTTTGWKYMFDGSLPAGTTGSYLWKLGKQNESGVWHFWAKPKGIWSEGNYQGSESTVRISDVSHRVTDDGTSWATFLVKNVGTYTTPFSVYNINVFP